MPVDTKLPGISSPLVTRSTASIASTPRAYLATPRTTGSESSFEEKPQNFAGSGRDNDYGRIGAQDPFPRPPRSAPTGARQPGSSNHPRVPQLQNLPSPGGLVGTPRSGRDSSSARRKFYFEPGKSFAEVPHGVSGTESVPQLKNFDVTLPRWIDQGITEQRTHLKLYYCDMLGRPKIDPPIGPDATEWEVEGLKEFVLASRPKTRLDAYPMLVITQDILRRLAADKIKIVSAREGEMQGELDAAQALILQLQGELKDANDTISKLRIGNMMNRAFKSVEGDHAAQKEQEERERARRELDALIQKEHDEKNAMAEEAERLKKLLAENRKQLENANRQVKVAQQQMDATMKRFDSEHARSPSEVFAMWSAADKHKIILEQILCDSELLGSLGLDAICTAWTMDGASSKLLLMRRLMGEMHGQGVDLLGALSLELQQDRYELLQQWETKHIESMAASGEAAGLQASAEFERFVLSMAELQAGSMPETPRHFAMKFAKDVVAEGTSEVQLLSQLLESSEEELSASLWKKLHDSHAAPTTDAQVQTEAQQEETLHVEKPKEHKKKTPSRKPLYMSAGSKSMPYDNVVRLIHEAYEVKILADQKDDAGGKPRQAFTDFLRDFLVRKYGLKSIANKHLAEIVSAVEKHSDKAVIRLFGVVSGMLDHHSWSPRTSDFVLSILSKTCDIEGRALSTISEWLNGDKEAGVSEEAAVFAASEVSTSALSFMPLADPQLAQLKLLPRNEVAGIYVHDFLLWSAGFLLDGRRRVKEGFMQLFAANDKNGDGVLEFAEFSSLIRLVIPTDPTFDLDERKISSLYDEAASMDGDDDQDSISKEAFSEMACANALVCPPQFIPS